MNATKNNNPLSSRWKRIADTFHEFPQQFWVLVLGTFVDRLGGALLFPFFTLYLTRRFDIGMTEVGVIFAMFSISSVIGSMVGGALTDRLGRKGIIIFGLVTSALSSLLLGLAGSVLVFCAVILVVGVLSESAGPAYQAMVADILPEEQRAQGYGILRVSLNLAVTFGPVIGGLLAARSYMLLFVCDAISSLITAGIVFVALKESYVPQETNEASESMRQTFVGYLHVLRDSAYVWYLGASMLMVLVYMQMNTSLGVFLRDTHGVSEQGFGYVLSLNAILVVFFQFSITRWVSRYRPLMVMAAGAAVYALGFALYGFVNAYLWFLLAMAIITLAEMMVSPVGQAIVARMAPDDMRGRYMAVYGFSWVLPTAFGPLLAGLVMDNFDPRWLWYIAGLVGLASAAAFYLIEWRVGRSRWAAVDRRLRIIEQLESGVLTADEAGRQLEKVSEGVWARLSPPAPETVRHHLRVRVSDLATGAMKVDLRLPVGLVNTVLMVGGQLSADLDEWQGSPLRELIAQTAVHHHPQAVQAGDEQMEVSVE